MEQIAREEAMQQQRLLRPDRVDEESADVPAATPRSQVDTRLAQRVGAAARCGEHPLGRQRAVEQAVTVCALRTRVERHACYCGIWAQ